MFDAVMPPRDNSRLVAYSDVTQFDGLSASHPRGPRPSELFKSTG